MHIQTEILKPLPNIKTLTYGKVTWIDIEKPTEAETQYLAQNYPFHKLELDDCLSRIQRPKVDIDEEDRYIFLVLHFPVFNKQARVTMASQVSAFLGKDYLITLHNGDLKPVIKLFADCETNEQTRREKMGHSSGYLLYTILDRLVDYCFPILNKIGSNIDAVEEIVFSNDPQVAVRELSLLRRDVLSYRRMVKPQTEVFAILEKCELPLLKEDPEVYFGDLGDHSRKILDTLEEYKEVIEGLNDTHNTLASVRMNEILRVLTILATIGTVLTMIASYYGMNIPLPGGGDPGGHPLSWLFILNIMLAIMGVMLWYFHRRHWV